MEKLRGLFPTSMIQSSEYRSKYFDREGKVRFADLSRDSKGFVRDAKSLEVSSLMYPVYAWLLSWLTLYPVVSLGVLLIGRSRQNDWYRGIGERFVTVGSSSTIDGRRSIADAISPRKQGCGYCGRFHHHGHGEFFMMNLQRSRKYVQDW